MCVRESESDVEIPYRKTTQERKEKYRKDVSHQGYNLSKVVPALQLHVHPKGSPTYDSFLTQPASEWKPWVDISCLNISY